MPLWLYWILLGLVAGTLAKFLVPGRDPSGCIITIVLGIVGAFIGGYLGTRFGWGTVTAGAFSTASLDAIRKLSIPSCGRSTASR